jgi:adenylate kinase
MEQVIEMSADGIIQLPQEVVTRIKSPVHFVIEEEADELVLRLKKNEPPFWATATPEEWVANFRQWMARIRAESDGRPPLPDEALHRESMYD